MLKQTEKGWTDVPMKVKDLMKALADFDPEAVIEIHSVAPKAECHIDEHCVMMDRPLSGVERGHNKDYNPKDWSSPYWDDTKVTIYTKGLI